MINWGEKMEKSKGKKAYSFKSEQKYKIFQKQLLIYHNIKQVCCEHEDCSEDICDFKSLISEKCFNQCG